MKRKGEGEGLSEPKKKRSRRKKACEKLGGTMKRKGEVFSEIASAALILKTQIYIYRILMIIIINVREKYRQTEKCPNYHALALFLFVKVSLSLLPSIPNQELE